MLGYFWLIPLPVLVTLLLTLLLGKKLGLKSAWLGMCGTVLSFCLALACAPAVFAGESASLSFTWFDNLQFGFLLDKLSLILLLLVAFLATLICFMPMVIWSMKVVCCAFLQRCSCSSFPCFRWYWPITCCKPLSFGRLWVFAHIC